MKKILPILLFAAALAGCTQSPRNLETELPRETAPEALTASFDSVFLAVNGVSCSDLHSLMVVQHGKVIYEQYGIGHDAEELHVCWSATKTVMALGVGLAVDDSLLDVQQPVASYLPLENETDPRWQQLTLDHVLSMTSGLRYDSITDRMRGEEAFDALDEIRGRGFRDEPGHRWRYNNCDSYLAARCVEAVTGKPLCDYIAERIFAPLGISEWHWEKDSEGHCPGGFGLHLSTESLAKIGQLILQKGEWNGQQVVSEEWIKEMTSVHSWQDPDNIPTEEQRSMSYELGASDWRSGYCYQMWACRAQGATRADGMWGQYVIVLPDKDAVCVMTTICTERSAQMDAFWKYVYEKL